MLLNVVYRIKLYYSFYVYGNQFINLTIIELDQKNV